MGSQEQGSLLSVLDRCRTSVGHRTMAQWLRQPLTDPVAINERLDLVGCFVGCVEVSYYLTILQYLRWRGVNIIYQKCEVGWHLSKI